MSELLDTLRDDHETPLSRLGSSKALYAVTGGEMDGDAVRTAAASEAAAAADLFDWWADDEPNDEAAALFSDLADTAREHADAVDAEPDGSKPNVYDVLAEFETTDGRLGGALARALVSLKTVEQMVGFFVGDADPMAANDFRTLKSDLNDQLDTLEATMTTSSKTTPSPARPPTRWSKPPTTSTSRRWKAWASSRRTSANSLALSHLRVAERPTRRKI